MHLSPADYQAIFLTLKLASIVTLILLIIATPLAWWLARTQSHAKGFISTIVAMPLVLPPSVLGFYFLLLLGPNGPIGQMMQAFGWQALPFTFGGLIVASVIYSLPFMVQPLQNAFESVGKPLLDAAASLGASTWHTFFTVVAPLSKTGFLTAVILTFVHTIGEFGVVLMIGGNIPGVTRVASVQIYDHVEALEYMEAHALSALMRVFSYVGLLIIYNLRNRKPIL
jgi:molybdate transport system permease protein